MVKVQKAPTDFIPNPSSGTQSSAAVKPQGAVPQAFIPRPMPVFTGSPWMTQADSLSASILSFARFFSLPLKPELMSEIRRQVLASETVQERAAGPEAAESAVKDRQALSLAAAAAEGKGVELSPQGLRTYAAALDPDWESRQGSDGRNRHRKRRGEREKENKTTKIGFITASELKEMALESGEKDPLLAILNRLPGKNGRRWIALPFSFSDGGREFRVVLRILLDRDRPAETLTGRMALDIAETGDTQRSWLFAVESKGGKLSRLAVFVRPAFASKVLASFALKLSRLLEIPASRVSVQNYPESFPGEMPGPDDLLHSVNEAV